MIKFALFGLGEAGSLFASNLIDAGHQVRAFDPADVLTPTAVTRCKTPAEAVTESDVVFSMTAAADAIAAMEQSLENLPATALYADFSTASAGLKRQLSELAESRGIAFVDVALLAVVPAKGIRTKALASGSGAERFVQLLTPLGMPVESIGDNAGDAATRKLLRSVFMKGLAAVVIEAMKAGQQAGLAEWLWENINNEIAQADRSLLRRLVEGTGPHAQRRLHEMEASEALLSELGIDPLMTRATVQSLKNILAEGLPEIPAANDY